MTSNWERNAGGWSGECSAENENFPPRHIWGMRRKRILGRCSQLIIRKGARELARSGPNKEILQSSLPEGTWSDEIIELKGLLIEWKKSLKADDWENRVKRSHPGWDSNKGEENVKETSKQAVFTAVERMRERRQHFPETNVRVSHLYRFPSYDYTFAEIR